MPSITSSVLALALVAISAVNARPAVPLCPLIIQREADFFRFPNIIAQSKNSSMVWDVTPFDGDGTGFWITVPGLPAGAVTGSTGIPDTSSWEIGYADRNYFAFRTLAFKNQTICAESTGGPLDNIECPQFNHTTFDSSAPREAQYFVTCKNCDAAAPQGCMIQSAETGQCAQANNLTTPATITGEDCDVDNDDQRWDFISQYPGDDPSS